MIGEESRFDVTVRKLSGWSAVVQPCEGGTVKALKSMVEDLLNIPVAWQRLMMPSGEELSDSVELCSEAFVNQKPVLTLMLSAALVEELTGTDDRRIDALLGL